MPFSLQLVSHISATTRQPHFSNYATGCNATATFQRLMEQALTSVMKKCCNLVMCYVDDVVIATPTVEDHIERLDKVLACMKRVGLKCKPSKCEILKDSIKYLGMMVDKHGFRPDPDAVEAVVTWK